MEPLFFSKSPFLISLSFEAVIKDLETIAEKKEDYRSAHAALLLHEIGAAPELREGITDTSQIEKNKELIGRLMADYFPESLTMNEIKAISIPYSNIIFNRSRRFDNILKAAGQDFEFNIRDMDEHQFFVLSCCLILNEYYHTGLDFQKPLFYDIPMPNGVSRHYRILYNADYLDIFPTERAKTLSPEDIELLINNYDNLSLWKEKFPEHSWLLKGFALMSLVDVTVENAVSILKERLLTFGSRGLEEGIEPVFQSIYRSPDIKIGFTLYSPEEGYFRTAAFGESLKSFILCGTEPEQVQKALCFGSYHNLIQEKKYFTVSNASEFHSKNPESPLINHFLSTGIQSFVLAPVLKNGTILGVLEVVSPNAGELNSVNANKLDVVMPFITDTIKRLVTEFQNQVQVIIQEKYTTIHPSVYWKFKTEAQKLIYDQYQGKTATLNEIVFPDVYPLYGQIDIRGSSEARNLSLQRDLQAQTVALLELVENIGSRQNGIIPPAEKKKLLFFLEELSLPLQADTEQLISDYLDNSVHPLLRQVSDPDLLTAISSYFAETDRVDGDFHAFKRRYEQTINAVNERLTSVIDRHQDEAQAGFPHYYERFKTDGVEHNLYIGASIAPGRLFSMENLHALRLWQMRVLCEMEVAHHYLKPALPYALDVTSLILVYNSVISIRFRMDEKRFDVDGSYNARFEIVKKRIDKAYIKNTRERITQPGKLTIVYSHEAEGQEYLQYIRLLQLEKKLAAEIEQFEVEELQGVAGLKALRTVIVHEGNH